MPDPKDTPMLRVYREVKAQQPEALLLMRMGDFYEAFLEDAERLSRLTGVALTSRNKDDPEPVAMAGIPHHQLPAYVTKLVAQGVRVAVMDQLEDPSIAQKEKRMVRRGLTRVITPGTLIDEEALIPGEANHLVACTGLDPETQAVGIAALDVSTGRFTVEEASTPAQLALALTRLSPAELVLPESLRGSDEILAELFAPASVPPTAFLGVFAWRTGDARRHLHERLGVSTLDGFDLGEAGHDHLCAAAAAALRYAEGALRVGAEGSAATGLGHIRGITRLRSQNGLVLDAACRRNLDLVRNSKDGHRQHTLLATVDRTRTAPGARLLADWLVRPLAEVAAINDRHDAVGFLVADDALRADVRDALGEVYDLERLAARIATGRAHGRDLVHLAASLERSASVAGALTGRVLPPFLAQALVHLTPDPDLVRAIRHTLVDDPPLTITEGGLVRDGVDPRLDELRTIRRDASAWLAAYQTREAEACGLKQLKVGYNQVFGYYLELPKSAAEKVPGHFIRKQTLVNAERYITPELKDYEDKALGAEDRIRQVESGLFLALRQQAEAAIPALQRAAAALARIDVIAGLAEVARTQGWCRPQIDDGLTLEFTALRHPVVESAVGRSRFVANDCRLSADQQHHAASAQADGGGPETRNPKPETAHRLAIITGPNMAGKSTYIRQIALAVILAQAGAYVPAESARVGLVDRVFTRIGAGDELARGQSTFMVEMAETAAILHHATRRSLVILDEVGRGTSTFDGVSLAWAITEHLHDRIGCRALFATHYHELTDLAEDRPGIGNRTVAVAEQDDQVAFLHRIIPGAATKSYGIHVAKLAGVPAPVITRARQVLATLERHNADLQAAEGHVPGAPPKPAATVTVTTPVQLSIFGAPFSPVLDKLKQLDPDALSPRQALDLLTDLHQAAKREL